MSHETGFVAGNGAVDRYRRDGRIKEAMVMDTAMGWSHRHHKETD
jgi:hypothetical protein